MGIIQTCSTGNACRKKALKLSKLYATPSLAEVKLCPTDVTVSDDTLNLSRVSDEFVCIALEQFGITLPKDFLQRIIVASRRLKECNRANVLYNLAKGLSDMRSDGSDSLLPARRMPMGLLEHVSNFFISESLQEVS